jgi:hypothetical protein
LASHSWPWQITQPGASCIHTLVPFVSAYLLYLRRDQLPKNYAIDLPLAIVSLAGGLDVVAFTYWLVIAGRAPDNNNYLALLTLSFLCCLAAGGFGTTVMLLGAALGARLV